MTVYYCTLIFVGVCRLLTMKITDREKRDNLFVGLSFVMIVALQGMRAITVGIDIPGYIIGYHLCGELPWFSEVYNYEIGYRILCKLIYLTGVSDQIFLVIIAIICQGSIFRFIKKYSAFPAISIMVYLTFGLFTFSFSGLRQMLAISILLFSYDYIKKGKLIPFVLVVLLAMTFHTSALVFFVAYPLYYWKISLEGVFCVIIGLLGEILLGGKIVQLAMLIYKNKEYEVQTTGAFASFTMFTLVWLGAIILCPPDKNLNAFKNCLMIAASIQCLGMYHESIGRLGYYFSFFICILLPVMVAEITKRNWKSRVLLTMLLITCCFVYFNINTGSGYLNVAPYVPYWEATV